MDSKYCLSCHCITNVMKFGKTSSGRQRYKCKKCQKTWTNKPRPSRINSKIWDDYVFHNYSLAELSEKYKKGIKALRIILDEYIVPEIIPYSKSKVSTICMDVTYFSHKWGVLSVLDAKNGNCLYFAAIGGYERSSDYEKAILELHKHGIYPKAAVVDGRKSTISMLEEYGLKVQLCQFHQIKTINRCLTKNPILKENKELRNIALSLTHVDKETFTAMIYGWKIRNEIWLQERTYLENGHFEYTHKLTRRAIHSLITNLPNLFVYEDYPELEIPNTNNKLEGSHSELKRRVGNHRGAKKELKIKIMRSYLSGRTGVKNNTK